MHVAYVDESGSPGSGLSFVLACILIPADGWASAFDDIIGYRRFLRDQFRIPVRAELKASYLLHNKGPLAKIRPALSEGARFRVYRGLMRLHAKIGAQTFAILIRQRELALRGTQNPRDVAWEYLLQRLERFTNRPPAAPTTVMLIHDEGEGELVRTLARKARRAGTAGSAFGTGRLVVPLRRLLDDPVSRDSRQAYFVQMADLAAYAAFRRVYPKVSARETDIVPAGMWDELGTARLGQANTWRTPWAIVVDPLHAAK
jgi:hypothetical protein